MTPANPPFFKLYPQLWLIYNDAGDHTVITCEDTVDISASGNPNTIQYGLDLKKTYKFEFEVKLRTINANNKGCLTRIRPHAGPSYFFQLFLHRNTNRFRIEYYDGTALAQIETGNILVAHEWYRIRLEQKVDIVGTGYNWTFALYDKSDALTPFFIWLTGSGFQNFIAYLVVF